MFDEQSLDFQIIFDLQKERIEWLPGCCIYRNEQSICFSQCICFSQLWRVM